MPTYFFDTSALVKHYHTEPGSPNVDRVLGETGGRSFSSRTNACRDAVGFCEEGQNGRDF